MKKSKKNVLLYGVIIILLLAISITYTFAKYVSNFSLWDYYLKSRGFYFSSDELEVELVTNNIDWNGGSVHFNIKNSEGITTVTDYDINYKVVCTVKGEAASHAACEVNGTESNTMNGILSAYVGCTNTTENGVNVAGYSKTNCELSGYTWINQIAISNLYFEIIPTDPGYDLNGTTVNITVTSTAPYKKVITGDFILHQNTPKVDSIDFDYTDYDIYGRLTVINSYPEAKCVKVNWNSEHLLIDEDINIFDQYDVDNNDYINEVVFEIPMKNSKSFIFYKTDFNAVYTESEFEVNESNVCQ